MSAIALSIAALLAQPPWEQALLPPEVLGDWSLDLLAQVGTGSPTLFAGAAIVWAPKILP